MRGYPYKKYAAEVMQELSKSDDPKIYEKFIKEIQRLSASDEYKKVPKCCGNCAMFHGSKKDVNAHCYAKGKTVKREELCEEYITKKQLEYNFQHGIR